jgi:acyl-CoA thioester hydrolase
MPCPAKDIENVFVMNETQPSSSTRYHDHSFRIRYAETDQMGVVHNAVYPVWFEIGRTELSHALGFPYAKIEEAGLALAVAEQNIRYKRPAIYDGIVTIRSWIGKSKPKVVQFNYQVFDEAKNLLAEGHTIHVVVNKETMKPTKMPADMLKHFQV